MAEFESCVSWSFEDEYDYDSQTLGSSDLSPSYECCLFTLPTTVKNCGEFRVYHIGPTQACSIAYCSAPESSITNSSILGTHVTSKKDGPDIKIQVGFQLSK